MWQLLVVYSSRCRCLKGGSMPTTRSCARTRGSPTSAPDARTNIMSWTQTSTHSCHRLRRSIRRVVPRCLACVTSNMLTVTDGIQTRPGNVQERGSRLWQNYISVYVCDQCQIKISSQRFVFLCSRAQFHKAV